MSAQEGAQAVPDAFDPTERVRIIDYLRKGAAVMIADDMAKLHSADDRREIETAARTLEVVADEIEKGAHLQ